jgi:hypothetical protein
MVLALFRMELHHRITLILLPLLLALSWMVTNLLAPGLDLSSRAWIGVLARDTLLLTAPCLAAFSALMAGLDRRQGTTEMLAATSVSPVARHIVRWGTLCLWGLLAYILISLWIAFAVAHPVRTWGSFDPGPWLVGLVALPAAVAVGSLVGTVASSRLGPPLLAIALFFGQVVLGWYPDDVGGLRFLSPVAGNNVSVWYGYIPANESAQITFFCGVTISCLALAVLYERWQAIGYQSQRWWWFGGYMTLAEGLCLGVIGILLLGQTPSSLADPFADPSGGYGGAAIIPFTPKCFRLTHAALALASGERGDGLQQGPPARLRHHVSAPR